MARRKNQTALEKYARLFASRGGKARREKLTPERRREIARDAARARWERQKRK